MADRPIYVAHLSLEAIAATTRYVLVDLSDTTNYPHSKTSELHILGIEVDLETHATGAFDLWFGAIIEVDASNGTANWIHVLHAEEDTNATDSAGVLHRSIDCTLGGRNPEGWNLQVASDLLTRIITNSQEAGDTGWQTDVALASPAGAAAGATGKPGPGDFVLKVEEVADTGTLDASITVLYEVG